MVSSAPFTSVNLPFFQNLTGTPGDQQWQNDTMNIGFMAGLSQVITNWNYILKLRTPPEVQMVRTLTTITTQTISQDSRLLPLLVSVTYRLEMILLFVEPQASRLVVIFPSRLMETV